ncbi:MAG: TetR/AcrR family transcriptional regulator [Actinomycetota bacterium]
MVMPPLTGRGRDEQPQRVLDVAAELFAQHGFDAVTMADIAEGANVARATVFNYFGSKHALIEALTETVLAFYREMLDDALADETTPTPDLLRHLYEEMGKGIESQRGFFRSVFREIVRVQVGLDEGGVAQRANDEAMVRLLRLMERGQRRGDLTDAFDPLALATAFRSLANGTISHWLYGDDPASLVARMQIAVDVLLSPIAQGGPR